MQLRRTFVFLALMALLSAGSIRPAHAQYTYTVLHNFGDGTVPNDGASPGSGLTLGNDGNFYGTTSTGGSAGEGTVYKVTPSGTVTILHSFGDGSVANDGATPESPLTLGLDGNFYGTTTAGGGFVPGSTTETAGTVFKITPSGTLTITHTFSPGALSGDGAHPSPGALVQLSDGTLYGETTYGGSSPYPQGYGNIYAITPSGVFYENLYTLGEDQFDSLGLFNGQDGFLYSISGDVNYGSFFKINPAGDFTEIEFFSPIGEGPSVYSGILTELNGEFLFAGGSPNPDIHGQGVLGISPSANLFNFFPNVDDATGFAEDIFGDAYVSNNTNAFGAITEVVGPNATSTAWSFSNTDGNTPEGIVVGTDGNIYGATNSGGSANKGVVFKLQYPASSNAAASFQMQLGSTDSHGAESGSPVTIEIRALDSDGNIAKSYAGTVHFTSFDPEANLPADATLTNGQGTFQAKLFTTGTQSITATDTVNTGVTGSGSILVLNATTLQVTAPSTVFAGFPFDVTVTALDQFGDVATGYAGIVHITSSDSAATLPGDATLTDGVGTFAVTLNTVGNQTVTATDTFTSSITGTSAKIAVPGAATHFLVSPDQNAVAGSVFGVTVTALDANDNTATGYAGVVHITTSEAGATLPANAALGDGTGVFFLTMPTPGTATITATDTVNPSITGTSSTFNLYLTEFQAGLQMISVPEKIESVSDVFTDTGVKLYDYSSSGYSSGVTTVPGAGFWVDFANPGTLLIYASQNSKPVSFTLDSGWNIIGDPYTTAEPVSSISVTATGTTSPVPILEQDSTLAQVTYTWQPGDTEYQAQYGSGITLQPYVGYWVYAFKGCTLTFN